MTNENSAKMSLEDKIVQTLKDDKLYALVGDEDAIADLVKRAIHESLFQPQRVSRGYGNGYDQKDSLVVEIGRAVAKKAAEKMTQTICDEIVADPALKKLINDAIAAALPEAIRSGLNNTLVQFGQSVSMDAYRLVQTAIQNRSI